MLLPIVQIMFLDNWIITINKLHFLSLFNLREDHPVPDGPFFTRDLYDKYSLAPNIRELWSFLQRYDNKLTY